MVQKTALVNWQRGSSWEGRKQEGGPGIPTWKASRVPSSRGAEARARVKVGALKQGKSNYRKCDENQERGSAEEEGKPSRRGASERGP